MTALPPEPPGTPGDREATPAEDAAVRNLLAGLPTPRMPAEVWDRLSEAFAAEPALLPHAAPDHAAGDATTAGADVVALGSRRAERAGGPGRWMRAVAGIAAALVAVAVGVQVLGRDGGNAVSADAGSTSLTAGNDAGEAGSSPVVASGTNYGATGLSDQVGTVMRQVGFAADPAATAKSGPEVPPPAVGGVLRGAAPADTAGTFAATPEGVALCLTELTGAVGVRALVIDLATYAGRPAAIVVLPAGDGAPDAADAWVVARTCRAGSAQVITYQRVSLG